MPSLGARHMLIDPHMTGPLAGISLQFTLTVLSHLRTAQSDFSSYLSRVGTDANRQAISVYLGGIRASRHVDEG